MGIGKKGRGRVGTDRNKYITNQNSLFRSRDWLSANQRPVFRSVPDDNDYQSLKATIAGYIWKIEFWSKIFGTKNETRKDLANAAILHFFSTVHPPKSCAEFFCAFITC
eukprot:sb/3477416/